MQRARFLFTQNKIAIIWDFDKTLIPYDMQRPLFEHFGVDEQAFWAESNALPGYYRSRGHELVGEQMYLQHILSYVRAGRFKGLSNRLLRQLGARLTFYPGLPELFGALKDRVSANPELRAHDIAVEHYVVSSGLRQMILGSAVAPYLDDVWACELSAGTPPGPGFLDRLEEGDESRGGRHDGSSARVFPSGDAGASGEAGVSDDDAEVSGVLYAIDDTSKTRAIFEINKGSNLHPQISVNAALAHDDRRVPFENMIYVADGPSDVPVFSIVNQQGGKTLGVFAPGDPKAFARADHLQRQRRVQTVAPADYTPGSHAYLWLCAAVDEIAQRMVATQHANIERRVGHPPTYRPPLPTAKRPAERFGRRLPGTSLAEDVAVPPVTANGEVIPPLAVAEPWPAVEEAQVPLVELLPDDTPLLHLPPPTVLPAASDEPHADEPQDVLLAIVSEISADTHRPISPAELGALRRYVAGRVSARSVGSRQTGSPRDVVQVTRAEIESQLEAIRRRGR